MPHARVDSGTSERLTRQKVSRLLRPTLLNPFIDIEEDQHPWAVNQSKKLDFPLMRVWDCCSGSVLDDDSRMLSRAPDESLFTNDARKASLTHHLNHRNWDVPTPYISFTSSPDALSKLACQRDRKRNRGEQYVTIIDPGSRIKNNLPVLDVAAEMKQYSIRDPYNRGGEYYDNHYVCLWEVTPEELVGQWTWEELAVMDDWYESVVIPAFNWARKRKSLGTAPTTAPPPALAPVSDPAPACASAFDMSALNEALPGQSPSEEADDQRKITGCATASDE